MRSILLLSLVSSAYGVGDELENRATAQHSTAASVHVAPQITPEQFATLMQIISQAQQPTSAATAQPVPPTQTSERLHRLSETLEEKCQKLMDENAQLKVKVENSKELTALSVENAELKRDLKHTTREIDTLKAQHSEKISDMKAQQAKDQQKIESLETALKELTDKYHKADKDREVKSSELATTRHDKEELTTNNNAIKEECARIEEKYEQALRGVQAEKNELMKEKYELVKQTYEQNSQLAIKDHRLTQAEKEASAAKATAQHNQKALELTQKKLECTQKELEDATNSMAPQLDQLRLLRSQLHDACSSTLEVLTCICDEICRACPVSGSVFYTSHPRYSTPNHTRLIVNLKETLCRIKLHENVGNSIGDGTVIANHCIALAELISDKLYKALADIPTNHERVGYSSQSPSGPWQWVEMRDTRIPNYIDKGSGARGKLDAAMQRFETIKRRDEAQHKDQPSWSLAYQPEQPALQNKKS